MKLFAPLIITAALLAPGHAFGAKAPRVLKFNGVPLGQAQAIKKRFPFVFEREVSLAEVDEVVRFVMKTGQFSNVEVVERDGETGERELVLVASLLRRISGIQVTGNSNIAQTDVLRVLNVAKGQAFERKNLLAAADELRKSYEDLGFHNAQVEIEFDVPSENEVGINVKITEGEPLRVSEVLIDSANPELNGRLQRQARSLKGKVLTEEEPIEFQRDVSEFLRKNRYLTARLSPPQIAYNPERTQARLVYTVENPWKFEFRFDGNQHFTEGTLARALEEEKLSGVTSSPAPDMADKIRRMYQNVGYANIDLSYNERLDDKNFKQHIRFDIKEGRRIRIKGIEIEGNVSRPSSYYAQFIKSSSSDLIGSGFYNRKDIDEGSKRLVTELQNQGYLRAKVQSQRVDYSKDKSTVVVYLAIEEGPLTQIRQIRFEGVEAFPKAQLSELLKIKTGAALGLKELEESIQILKDFYRSEGFLEMKILNENEQSRIVTYNDTNTQATVEFQIYEGPRVIVGSVVTQGNSFTKDYVIERELAFKTGDVLTPEKIDETVFRLQKLGLFSQVDIKMLEADTIIGERTIIIDVAERDPGLFTMGIGVNNDKQLTFRGYLGIAYRNILGTGRALSFRVDPRYSTDPRISYLENSITVSYLEPYIFGDRNRGRVNVVRQQVFDDFRNDTAVISEENSVGLLLERDLTRHIKLTYTAYNFSNQRKFLRPSREDIETLNIATTGPLIEFDYRDDAFNPTKGSYSVMSLEYSDPRIGSSEDATESIKFFKSNASVTTYSPLNEKRSVVWASSVRGGYLANLSDRQPSGVPYGSSFRLGGRTTIRGFDAGSDLERIPNRLQLKLKPLEPITKFRVTSDSYYYLVKTELRFPIYGSFGGTIFYDGGAVLLSQLDIPDPYRDSVGFGIRIATPVGPVNAEIGWKLDRKFIAREGDQDLYEAPWVFHFSIGSF